MDVKIKNKQHFTSERDSVLFTFDAGTAFISGQYPTPLSDSQ
jgi:hypothetical protein